MGTSLVGAPMTKGKLETGPRQNAIPPRLCTSTEKRSVPPQRFSRVAEFCRLTLSALVGLTAVSCGGDVATTAGTNADHLPDAAMDGSVDPYAAANMSLLTNDQWQTIQSPACAAPVTFELFADSGASQCNIIVPVQNMGGTTIWCPIPAFVLSLPNGERYAIHFENDCSAGGVVKDPANPEVGAIFCPNTCAVMVQSAHSVLQVVESCGGCVSPTE